MYAVIATGGKQYRVTKGETLRVEKLAGEEGDSVELDGVLMVADGDKVSVGTPMLDKGASRRKLNRRVVARKSKSSNSVVASIRVLRQVIARATPKSK